MLPIAPFIITIHRQNENRYYTNLESFVEAMSIGLGWDSRLNIPNDAKVYIPLGVREKPIIDQGLFSTLFKEYAQGPGSIDTESNAQWRKKVEQELSQCFTNAN